MPFGNRNKLILEDLFSSVLPQLKKFHSSGHLKIIYLSIFQSLKLRIIMDFFSISLKLNFTPNTLGLFWVKRRNGRKIKDVLPKSAGL